MFCFGNGPSSLLFNKVKFFGNSFMEYFTGICLNERSKDVNKELLPELFLFFFFFVNEILSSVHLMGDSGFFYYLLFLMICFFGQLDVLELIILSQFYHLTKKNSLAFYVISKFRQKEFLHLLEVSAFIINDDELPLII